MADKKYPRNIWSRLSFALGILLTTITTMYIYKNVNKQVQEEQSFEEGFKCLKNSNRPSFAVVNVNYHDTAYRVIVREERYYLEEKYQKGFEYALEENGILNIDSATYSLLKTKIVKKQDRIDSLYNGEVKNLISTFFNEQGVVATFLSDEEVKYLIDILFQNNIPMNIDCETGALVISK